MARREHFPIGVAAAAILLLLSTGARGQDRNGAVAPRWGTKDHILSHVPFNEFFASDSTDTTIVDARLGGSFGLYSNGGGGLLGTRFFAVPHLPSGALLTYLELDYCDTSLASDVSLVLLDCSYRGDDCNHLQDLSSGTGTVGCGFVFADETSKNYTMNNNLRELVLVAVTEAGDSTTQLNGVYVGYKLQVSPAPGTATFGDVPTSHLYFRAIEALAASGITGGCGSGNFCPNQNVTRGEMAAFLVRALGLHFPN